MVQFEEHNKRVWSVDYSSIDPTRLVSGSDDGTIKIWTLNQESSVATIDCKVFNDDGIGNVLMKGVSTATDDCKLLDHVPVCYTTQSDQRTAWCCQQELHKSFFQKMLCCFGSACKEPARAAHLPFCVPCACVRCVKAH